jgi:hypothetical protein
MTDSCVRVDSNFAMQRKREPTAVTSRPVLSSQPAAFFPERST